MTYSCVIVGLRILIQKLNRSFRLVYQKIINLAVRYCHNLFKHCRARATLAEIRSRFWTTNGRQYVKKVLRDCFVCRKLEGNAFPAPANIQLPHYRIAQSLPFASIGSDFAGPIYYKTKEGMMKSYIALFTCSEMGAAHLELKEDLTTLKEETVAGRNCREINLATFATVSSAKDHSWPFRDI